MHTLAFASFENVLFGAGLLSLSIAVLALNFAGILQGRRIHLLEQLTGIETRRRYQRK